MSIPKRRLFVFFWDSPPPERPAGHINPKTIWNNFPQSGGVGSRAGGEASREAGRGRARGAVGVGVGEAVVGEAVVGEAGGRLCPRETHGRPWPCEWVARRHCVKRRGERQYVAKTRHERRDERRDGAKRKVSEGSILRWRWWQRRRRRGGRKCGGGSRPRRGGVGLSVRGKEAFLVVAAAVGVDEG